MKMKYWSDYEKYIVMVHGAGNTPKGINLGYQAFLEFKKVKEALISISKRPGNTYSDGDDIYKRPITSTQAIRALDNLENCRWDENIRLVAKQMKIGYMLSPAKMCVSSYIK